MNFMRYKFFLGFSGLGKGVRPSGPPSSSATANLTGPVFDAGIWLY